MTTQFFIDDTHVHSEQFAPHEIKMLDAKPALTALGAVRELAYQRIEIPADARAVIIRTPTSEHTVPMGELKELLDAYRADVGRSASSMPRASELDHGHCIVLGPFPKWLQPDDLTVFRKSYPAIFVPGKAAAQTQAAGTHFDTLGGGPGN